jgi:hypothetical protein
LNLHFFVSQFRVISCESRRSKIMIRATAFSIFFGTHSAPFPITLESAGEVMGRKHDKKHSDKISYARERENAEQARGASRSGNENQNENPPRTTSSGWFTTPKFGGATSGGGEIEPGP